MIDFQRSPPPLWSVQLGRTTCGFTFRVADLAFISLLLAWPWIGLFGHEPWKPDEAYSFGLVYSFLQGQDFLIPSLAGTYFLEKPPLFYWAATASAQLFGGLLPLPDAARVVVALFAYLTLGFLTATARILLGPQRALLAPILLVSALGLFDKAHLLITDAALLAGISSGLFGLALALRRPLTAGLALGAGALIAFMSKGLLGPGVLAVTVIVLLLWPEYRSRAMARCIVVAVAVCLPLALIWPVLLYLRSPDLFMEWFWVNNLGRYLGFVRLGHRREIWFYPTTLLWFSFPLWPLALVAAAKGLRVAGARSQLGVPGAAFAVMLTVLMLSSDARALYTLPLLLPLALLAAAGVDHVAASVGRYAHRATLIIFPMLIASVWLLWLGAMFEWPESLRAALDQRAPGFVAAFAPAGFGVALLGTVLWVLTVTVRPRAIEPAIRNCAAGVTSVWLLVTTLGMPALDYVKSYKTVIAEVRDVLSPDANCVAGSHLGEPVRAMLHYYADLITRDLGSDPAAANCDFAIVQVDRKSVPLPQPEKWERIWHGSRPGDLKEALEIFRRDRGEARLP